MVVRERALRAASGLRALLTREDWIYLLSLLVPLVVYDLILKVVRVIALPGTPGLIEFLDQIRSEVFFNLGYAILWIGLFAVARRGATRLVVLVLFHLSAIAVAAVTTSAHFFYKSTGSVLDYDLIALSLSNWREIQAVVMTETTLVHWLLLSAVLFYAVAGPAMLTGLLGERMHVPLATPGDESFRAGLPVVVCAAALGLGVLSLLPSVTGSNKSFARASLANMIVTELAEGGTEEPNPEIATELAAEDLPTDAALRETQSTTKRNVVMVFLESTRASATTPYNADLDTTPYLAELAKDSLLVENTYTVVPHTSKALVASHCGVAPPLDSVNTEAEPDILPAQCVPDLLKEQGYATAFFQSATETFERRRMAVANFGHENFFPLEALPREGFAEANYFGYEDDVMLEPSAAWLEQQKEAGRPFMASYLTVTAHHDYVVPEGFEEKKYVKDEELNRYLNTVAYQDRFLEKLIQEYKHLGLYEDTIFVVMGDHGEGFGEHGRRQHDDTIYEEGLKVPMLIHDPKRFDGGVRIEGPANQLDILPTLTGLLGYDITSGTYPGSPLYALPDGRPVMVSCYHDRKCLASIEGSEKYVYHFDNQDEEFFDLVEDPEEKQNIIDEQPSEEIERRRDELLAWSAKVNAIYERQQLLAAPGETTGGMEE
jgi:phosphoglycerol transferase MdoB-like AlkP superfamily enzyme